MASVLHVFSGPPDGSYARDAVIDQRGNLFSTTSNGAAYPNADDRGTVFELEHK